MQAEQLCEKITNLIFLQFNQNRNEHLSKFQFSSSLNFLSKKVGGVICPRSDLDIIFQLIDQNGDQTISKREYVLFMKKFVKIIDGDHSPAYRRLLKYSEMKPQDINLRRQ